MATVWRKDNGTGGLADAMGAVHAGASVNYGTGAISFNPDLMLSLPVPEYTAQKLGKEKGTDLIVAGIGAAPDATYEEYRAQLESLTYTPVFCKLPVSGGYVKVRYAKATSLSAKTHTVSFDDLTLDLTPHFKEEIVAGSVRAAFGGKTLIDRLGSVVTDIDHATGAATSVGALDYSGGLVQLTNWTPGAANSGTVISMLTNLGAQPVDSLTFRVPAAPVRPGSFVAQFTRMGATGLTTVTASTSGEISGAGVYGSIDYDTGIVKMRFGSWVTAAGKEGEWWYPVEPVIVDGKIFRPDLVMADTLRFACVSYSYLPLDADILGLNPVRLPSDGRVSVFRPGDVLVVHHTAHLVGTYSNETVSVGRTRLARVRVFDATDTALDPLLWSADLDAGTVTLGIIPSGLQPIRIEHRIEDMGLCSDAQINGQLTMTRPLTHAFPVPGAQVSSALIIGDMQSRYTSLYEQGSWDGVWQDDVRGSSPTASYNDATFPVLVDNAGCIQERWALIFTTPTQVRVVGETVGQIADGLSISATISPVNPATGRPYFTVNPGGWGSGWASGNVLRFNTIASNFPIWIARTIQQGPATEETDSFCLQIRGDIDRT
jgi:hypothetical protein